MQNKIRCVDCQPADLAGNDHCGSYYRIALLQCTARLQVLTIVKTVCTASIAIPSVRSSSVQNLFCVLWVYPLCCYEEPSSHQSSFLQDRWAWWLLVNMCCVTLHHAPHLALTVALQPCITGELGISDNSVRIRPACNVHTSNAQLFCQNRPSMLGAAQDWAWVNGTILSMPDRAWYNSCTSL